MVMDMCLDNSKSNHMFSVALLKSIVLLWNRGQSPCSLTYRSFFVVVSA